MNWSCELGDLCLLVVCYACEKVLSGVGVAYLWYVVVLATLLPCYPAL